MILTEDKTYTISLEQEDCGSTTGLVNKNTELVFSNKELLHAVVTCGMPIQRMTASFLSKKKLELTYKMFLVETALDTEGDRLKKAKRIAYLDSSEKSVMSYYMGMFLTKLISGRLYGADYLTHLNLISSIDQKEFIDFFNSEWRQDMIGLSIPCLLYTSGIAELFVQFCDTFFYDTEDFFFLISNFEITEGKFSELYEKH